MAKVFVRAALCVALVLCGGSISAGGEVDRKDEPAVTATPTARGRESKIRVHPPTAEAQLFFEGSLTSGTGLDRTFRSPALEEGKRYAYKIVVVWRENGRVVTHEASIAFWAGQDLLIDFRR